MAGVLIERLRPLELANHLAHLVRRVPLELSIPKKQLSIFFFGSVETK